MESTQKRTITRNRELLACTECRRRKLKCNRHTPCTTCVRRGDEASCTYQRFASGLEHERERRLQAEARLEHLEQLVQELAQHGDGSSPHRQIMSHQVIDQQATREEPSIEIGAFFATKEPVFNGSTHWSAMLADIDELRSVITLNEATMLDDDIVEYNENIATSMLLGSAVSLPIQQVLAQYLPSRQEADRLIAAYFRSRGLSAPFIHASYFRRLYRSFWIDPMRAPVLWTSMLFSILHIARNTLNLGNENTYPDHRYNVASAHCLTLGEYFRPKQFSVESLLLFAQAQCLTGPNISSDLGLIFGLLIHLASSMGYHRDPDLFQLSTFDKEIRRRSWSLCMQLDLLISFQLGLPSHVQFPTWDTQPPRNLLDSDFDEDTKELPPARPDSESTDILFYIAKHRLMTIFEKVLRHTLSTGTSESTDVDKLDTEIRDTYSSFPEILRPRPLADSVVDPPPLVVTRLCVFFIYQKCLCVLHRPYVTRGRLQSIQICSSAASNIVRHFNDTYKEFLPGGQLETERWFMSSITWHDYLLGVIALCMVLCAGSQIFAAIDVQFAETLQLLRRAEDICLEQSARSKDSRRVRKVVNATLLHFGSQDDGDTTNEVGLFTNKLQYSLPSPFADGQTGPHGFLSPEAPYSVPPGQTEADWVESQSSTAPMSDFAWAYLEQFLNLSDDDHMPDT